MHSRLELHQPASVKVINRSAGSSHRPLYPRILEILRQGDQDANYLTQQFQSLVEKCTDPKDRIALQQVSAQASSTADKRPSILQLLRHYPSIKLPLEKLATMLPPLRPRQYSISSSPLVDPSSLKLTWSLITRGPSASLPDEPPTRGLASHYLAGLKPGDTLKCTVRRGNPRFKPVHLAASPASSASAPMIMICAGSGIAPFRAFIEHRAGLLLRRQPGHHPPPPLAILYAGHRSPMHAPYASELESWRAAGVVDVRYAYSRGGAEAGLEGPAAKGCHVQDRIWKIATSFGVCGRRARGSMCVEGEV